MPPFQVPIPQFIKNLLCQLSHFYNPSTLNETYTFEEPCPQRFSLPLPIIKYLIDHSTPTVWKKLIKTCKYFYTKNPAYPISRIKAIKGFKWDADGEVFDPTQFTPKIWLYDSVMIYASDFGHNSFYSPLIPMVTVNDIRSIDIFYQDLSWEDYQFLTTSPKFERLHAYETSIKYSDDTFVTYDKLLENLPSLKYFKISCMHYYKMFKPDTVKKILPILSEFKTDPFILFQDLPDICNYSEFIDLIMKNKTVNLGFDFFAWTFGRGKEKCENFMNTIFANPPKRIPFLELPNHLQDEYEEYQKLYEHQARSA